MTVALTDTHCHLDLEAFDADRDTVIGRALEAGLTRILIPSLGLASALRVHAMIEEHFPLYGAVGVHPTELDDMRPGDLEAIGKLAIAPKVVAIGEVGLDYYWVKDPAKRRHQRDVLRAQLDLARSVRRPVILHLREAEDAGPAEATTHLLEILEAWILELRSAHDPLAQRPGVLHSFSGSIETAGRAIALGFYIGVTGPITFKSAERRRQVAAALPLDRILIETDAPFLAPQPHRGERNEPAFVVHIADRIADVQSRAPHQVAEATSANAARLFAWGEAS